jgi:hypothetical protein
MNWLIYAGVFLFGAIALLIEARRNYDQSLNSTPFTRHPILASAKVSDLCTPRDGFIGYLIYSLLYLLSYVVILSSAELYDLIRNANLAKLEVGATQSFDPFANDVLNLEGTVYAKPIFVSAFLIAIMSVGAMKPIENAVRSAAHRLAGIPRGVYQVIDLLQTPRFHAICRATGDGVLLKHFCSIERTTELEDPDLAQYSEDIKRALRTIDALWPSVSPSRRAEFFPAAELDKLNDLTNQLNEEMRTLRATLLNFDPNKDGALRSLAEMSRVAANNTKALFAVHYIRNNRYVKNLRAGTVLKRVIDNIDRNYNPEQNSFAMAACACFFASFAVIAAIYIVWHAQFVEKRPFSIAKDQIEASFEQATGVSQSQCTEFFNGISASDLGPDQVTECNMLIGNAQTAYLQNILIELAAQSMWDTFQAALVVFIAVGTVTFGREVRLEQESWRTDWSFKRIPFLRLFGLCLLPSVFAGIVALGGTLAELAVDADFKLTQTQVIHTIQSNRVYFAMMPLVGFITAFGTLIILDKHNHLTAWSTLVIALVAVLMIWFVWAGVIFFGYNYPAWTVFDPPWGNFINIKTRDWLIQVVLATLFIPAFAMLLEFTEEDPDDLLPQQGAGGPDPLTIPLRGQAARSKENKVAAE